MKKLLLTIVLIISVMVSVFAQAPQKFSYQAVVRDADNNLVATHAVGVRVSLLQGSPNGAAFFVETHTITTNANGLMTLEIGAGTAVSGDFSTIDWADGPYFLKTETDPDGGTNYTIEGTQQLLSVPYALYAGNAANGFSGSYNDLTDQPTIPTVPTNVSAFTNDAGYITSADIPAYQVLSISNDTIYLTNGGYVVLPAGFDGDYNSLTNAPEIPIVPTNVSAFNNDAGYITAADVPAQVNADWNATVGAAQILNKPELFSGDYNDLSNQPVIPTTTNDLTNNSGFITSADVPTNVSAFANDAGYITSYTEQQVLSIRNDTIYLTGGSYVKLPAGFSGNYNDLTNQPTIPTIPDNVSDFANDANYVNNADCNNVSFCELLNMLTSLQNTVDSLANVVAGNNPPIEEPCTPTSSTYDIEITTAEFPYAFGDTTFLAGTETGTYVLLRTNAAGCDSTITINLTVNEPGEDFICGTSTITDADNNTYNTVRIGNQCWMKENLRTTKKPNGENITEGMWVPGTNSVETYGRLYSWTTVMNGAPSSNATPSGVQGICPTGWHVPSDNEWKQMEMMLGMSQSDADLSGQYRGDIAAKLSGNIGWNSSSTANAAGNLNAPERDSTGFSALPAGLYTNGNYYVFGGAAYFWTATELGDTGAYNRFLNFNYAGVGRNFFNKTIGGYSVRCVRD